MTPISHELSTQEPADLLNVCESYLINLLEEGKISYRKEGLNCLIMTQDVIAYTLEEDQARFKVLAELTEESQKLGFYDE